MEKNQNTLKIIIIALIVIIVLLIGIIIFFASKFKFIDKRNEKDEITQYNSDYSKYDEDDEEEIYPNNISTEVMSNNNSQNNKIAREDALKIALEHAKIDQKDIRNIDIELEYKYNQTVYEVTFDYQQYEYEYYINSENGNIIKSFREID